MTILTSFVTEMHRRRDLLDAEPGMLPTRLAQTCVSVFPVDGAGISLFTDDHFRFPVGSSDDSAAVAERLEFTAADGPSLRAREFGRPVAAPEAWLAARWPLLHDQLVRLTPYRAVLALPLRRDPGGFGSMDLYLRTDVALAVLDVPDVARVAALIGSILVQPGGPTEPSWLGGPAVAPRRLTMTAAGMLTVALGVTTREALDTLRARAYATDTSIDDVAADVVARRLPLADFRLSGNT